MEEIEANGNIRAVILWGTGKHFSTGADINWFKDLAVTGEAEKKRVADLGAGAVRRLFSLPISTIALVQNTCFGDVIGYVAGCDIAIASEDARFAISEVRIGITSALILS